MKRKENLKYGVLANSFFMLREAKLAVAVSVLELYVAPVILRRLEQRCALTELLYTILLFTLGIMSVCAAKAYVNANLRFGRIEVRNMLMNRVRIKGIYGVGNLPQEHDFIIFPVRFKPHCLCKLNSKLKYFKKYVHL